MLVHRAWKDDWAEFEPVLMLLADSTARAAEISVNLSVRMCRSDKNYVTSVHSSSVCVLMCRYVTMCR